MRHLQGKRTWHRHSARRDRPRPEGEVYAALDLGTNNCRMLMAVPDGAGFRVIDSFSRSVRLGEGLDSCGILCDEAIGRTIGALTICAAKIRANGARRVRAIATEACRRATNRDAFLERVRAETHISFQAITAQEEAALTVAGCTPFLDGSLPYGLIFDIGGGSTEVMWIRQEPDRAPEMIDHLSIPLGVVTLAEQYGFGPIGQEQRCEIRSRIDAELTVFCARNGISAELAQGRIAMLGTSGTITTLGAMHLGLKRYQRPRVDGLWLALDRIRGLSERLLGMDLPERASIPSIGQSRADLVAVGCAILEAICSRWPASRVRVADRGIREGLLMAMIQADQNASPAVAGQ
jgi:exopolyphosphatase/guanosine-5'-triphosphate,3'-diphosphate pyrophosphatase